MRWKEARVKLRELIAECGNDLEWSAKYKEAVKIGMERIEEVEDLELEEDA